MPEPRTTATVIAVRTEPMRAWAATAVQAANNVLGNAASWLSNTAQEFGSSVSALMGPAVFAAYAFAAWSLAANLGWTDTFVFTAGPLSNWLIWLGIAILVHTAANILRRHSHPGD